MDTLQDIYVLLDSPAYSLILENPPLYLGSIDATRNRDFMAQIDAMVSAVRAVHVSAPEARALLPAQGVESHLFLDVRDRPDEDIGRYFEECSAFIQKHREQGHSLLIHCMSGRSRSTTLLAAHLLLTKEYSSVYDVLEFLKEKRCIIHPNTGFILQLLERF